MNEDLGGGRVAAGGAQATARPTAVQAAYLRRGLSEPGGKLPLFDRNGQRYANRTIRSCIDQGWATTWFNNPIKPDWLICRLTEAGEAVVADSPPEPAGRSPLRTRPKADYDARRLQRLVRDLVEA
jgi:hypothetical protein